MTDRPINPADGSELFAERIGRAEISEEAIVLMAPAASAAWQRSISTYVREHADDLDVTTALDSRTNVVFITWAWR